MKILDKLCFDAEYNGICRENVLQWQISSRYIEKVCLKRKKRSGKKYRGPFEDSLDLIVKMTIS